MKYFIYIFFSLMIITPIKSIEYVYPVASYNNGATILLLQQLSQYTIELLLWNKKKNFIEKGLWSLFKPAGLQLLPDESGFSFIDNGRLRIKYFNKRSCKTIDFDEYFYMINLIHWINSKECYCSAKISDYYSLFHCTTDGYSYCIASSDKSNCLYPQKINSNLFFIEESYDSYIHQKPCYCIKHTAYPTITHSNNQSYSRIHNTPRIIINFQNRPLIFLHMISEEQGFVIEHAQEINDNDKSSTFLYHHLIKNNDSWESQLLFSFALPTYLFLPTNENSLYESLLPLVPRIIGTKIYFVDSTHNQNNDLESYIYDITFATVKKIEQIKINSFVPMLCGKSIVFGGIMNNVNNLQTIPFLT